MKPPSKPFLIDKRQVYEAYKAVRSKEGAGGVDGVTIEQFEKDLKGNLYKIWNRMSSGAYFPPPVRAVTIPKKNGGQPILGVPTVADRVAQTSGSPYVESTVQWAPWLRSTAGLRGDAYWFHDRSDNPLNSGEAHSSIVSPKLVLCRSTSTTTLAREWSIVASNGSENGSSGG